MVLTLLLHRKMFEVSNLLFALFVLYSACGDGLFYTLRVEMVSRSVCGGAFTPFEDAPV